MNSQAVICWNTHKTETGTYRFDVYTIAYQIPSQILKTGECATRARAVANAKAWTRFLKASAARLAREG